MEALKDSYLDMTENYCNKTHAATPPQLSACSSIRYASPRANAAAYIRKCCNRSAPPLANHDKHENRNDFFRSTQALARSNQQLNSVIPFLPCDLHCDLLRAYSNKMIFTSLLFSQTQMFFSKNSVSHRGHLWSKSCISLRAASVK